MSTTQQQQPVSSSPRLTYTRDFLLKFQHITKADNSLAEVLKPFLTPQPRKTVPFGSSTRRPVSSTVEKSKDFHIALDHNEAMVASSPTLVMPNGAKWRGENSKAMLTGLLQGQSDPANPGHTGKKFDARRALTNANQSNSNANNNTNHRAPLSDLSKGRGLNGQSAAFSPRGPQALPKITVTPLSPLQGGANKENVLHSNGRFDSPVSDLAKSWRTSPSTTPSKLKDMGSAEKKAWKIPTNEDLSGRASGPASPTAAHLFSASSSLYMSPEATRRTVKMSLVSPASPSTPASESAVKSPKTGSPKIIDQHQLEQRQKQVDYGHQTLGYLRYRLLVPKDKRSREDPRTPKKSQACSKRSWDGQVKKWRRDLHKWDPEDSTAFVAWLESDFVIKIIENNIGSELIELIRQIKERAAKFQNSPAPSPSADGTSPTLSPTLSPTMLSPAADRCCETAADLDDEKVARKLVF